ncbi:MAG: prolipoprotein diacylglyceryl transferase [Candidatus Andersenbacteria bacterium]
MADIRLFPAWDTLIDIGSYSIRWYGVLYVAAFWLAWWWLPRLQRFRSLRLSRDEWTVAVAAGALGVLLGGRLGYVLFYEPLFYFHNPLEVFAIWNGGMSSHGGFIGVGLALWWAAKYFARPLLDLLDIVVVPVALGLALGRLGNWLNGELYIGQAALVAAVIHVGIALLLLQVIQRSKVSGISIAVFLVLYSLQRFIFEEFRILEWPEVLNLTRGQLLTAPVLCIGLWLLYRIRKQVT